MSAIYFLIPHLEWFVRERLVFDQNLISVGDCFLATGYMASYVAVFLFGTWLVFRRKILTS